MSEATPRPPSSIHPTRQQLDELQALMEQMLALPVNQLDKDTGPVVPPLFDPGPGLAANAEAGSGPSALDLEPFSVPSPSFPPATVQEQQSDFSPAGVRLAGGTTGTFQDQVEEAGSSRQALPRQRGSGGPDPIGYRSQRRAGWIVRGLVRCNRVFDHWMGRLGKPGRWLRSPAGRTFLGWLGLLCLASALILGILEGLGWPE